MNSIFKLKKSPSIDDYIADVANLKLHLSTVECPSCSQKTVKLADYKNEPNGRTVKIYCTNCETVGTFTKKGFEVALSEPKPKPQEPTEKKDRGKRR